MASTFRCFAGILLLACVVDLTSSIADSATLPAGFSETQIASGLLSPTAMTFAPDGRLFVAQQGGRLRVIRDSVLLANPFLTLSVDASGERGLLGVAFDPNFASNNFVYVYYTTTSPNIHNRLSRFTASGDVAVAGSEVVLLDLNPLSSASNHNGGAIHFGIDGKLYIAVGENANGANSQTLGNLLGKILRINADGTIPTDNPFYGTASGVNRAIWALGLRNPFTFSVDPYSGRIFINDVGQDSWEEINDGIAGSNYGWPNSEGSTSDPNYRSPLYFYSHGSGTFQGCAITGGSFYNPGVAQFPASYVGDYFFADYCGGWINVRDPSTGAVTRFASGIVAPVDIQLGSEGKLYYLARGSGSNTGGVFRIEYAGNQAPSITQHPADRTVQAGQSATFSVVAAGSAPLNYQWQRNGSNIPGATSQSYTIASAAGADNGARFRCVVTNSAGTATSNEGTLTVTSQAVATITQPQSGAMYSGGQVIGYAGTGTEGGANLPASAFTWQVDFHHDTHVHPFMQPTSGATSGTFTIPTSGETSSNVWYRIYLTVRDSQGLTTTTFRDVSPRTAAVTIATSPSGLGVTLDGQPFTAPYTFTGVVGIQRTIGAPTPQAMGGYNYTYGSWSDGGAATHGISTPSSATTFTATFNRGSIQPTDITTQGTPIALIMSPTGGGSRDIGVIRDGVFPAVGSTNSSQQYDTYTGDTSRALDWIGYSFAATHSFTSLDFQEGREFPDGGWFATLTVQVRVSGAWTNVSGLTITPTYPGANGTTFERFSMAFTPVTGDAVRISGTPGGAARFISVGELRAWSNETSPPTGGSDSVWNSWDVVTQSGTPQGQVTATTTGIAANLEFYESTNNGGVSKGALFGGFTAGSHPDTFNRVQQYWGGGTGAVYPYAGKSTVNRGADAGETNAPPPSGVRDLQLHPPNNLHLTVAAFRVPIAANYKISNLAVRRVYNLGESVNLHVFNTQQVEIATLSASANQAWVTSASTYTLSGLTAGAYIYFAVDRGVDYTYDATEIAWTITADDGTPPPPPPPATVTVTAPNGGENWVVGSTQTIRWTASGVNTVNLDYRTSSSGAWTSIVQNLSAASGAYSWTVPSTPTTQARIRVTDAANPSTTDLSNGDFSISTPSGSSDVTAQGTAIALITAPTGGGNPSLSVIRDGVYPATGSTSSAQQYDTYTGDTSRALDWIGYSFAAQHMFTSMDFQEGRQFSDGGWFATLTVQVRVSGVWTNVSNLTVTPAYPGPNGVTFERFTLSFTPLRGDAIRISGMPGGSARFISVGELRAWASD